MYRLRALMADSLALAIGVPILVVLLVATGLVVAIWGWDGIAAAWRGLSLTT